MDKARKPGPDGAATVIAVTPLAGEPAAPARQDPVSNRIGLIASGVGHALVIALALGALATAHQSSPTGVVPIKVVPAVPRPPQSHTPQPAKGSTATAADARRRDGQQDRQAGAPKAPETPGKADASRTTTLTRKERDALVAQAKRCWKIPPGWTTPRQASVTVRAHFNRDGTVAGIPVVVEFPASPLGKAAADNAVRALPACGPYRLPADKYDQWRDVQMAFTP